jgi:hypothetical protein
MINSRAQPMWTGFAHDDHVLLATAPRHRNHAGQRPKRVRVPAHDRIMSLGQQRGKHDRSDTGHGSQDLRVATPFANALGDWTDLSDR